MKRRARALLSIVFLLVAVLALASLPPTAQMARAAPAKAVPAPSSYTSPKDQADQAASDADALYQQGDVDGAIKKWKEALQLYYQANDYNGVTQSLNKIGAINYNAGRFDQALTAFQQLLQIQQAAQDDSGQGETLGNIGLMYQKMGQYDPALNYDNQALNLAQQTGNQTLAGIVLGNIGLVYYEEGKYDGALNYYNQALQIAQDTGDVRDEGTVTGNIAAVYEAQEQFDKALDAYKQAEQLVDQAGDSATAGNFLASIGGIYDHLGEFSQAFDYYNQALQISKQTGNLHRQSVDLNNIGLLHYELGEYDQALDFYGQAQAIVKQLGDNDSLSSSMNNFAQVYGAQGEYDKALQSEQVALSMAQQVGNVDNQAGDTSNIGAIYYHLGQTDKALDFYNQALALAQKSSKRQSQSVILGNIAGVYDAKAEYDKAVQYDQQALQISNDLGDLLGQSTILNNIGFVYAKEKQYDRALQNYGKALQIEQENGYKPAQGTTVANMGVVNAAQGDQSKALDYYQQSVQLAQQVDDPQRKSASLGLIGDVYKAQEQPDKALGYYTQAIQLRENLRSATRIEEFKTSLASQSQGIYESAVLLLADTGKPADGFNLAERARARTFLDQLGNTKLDITRGADPKLVQQESSLRQEEGALDGDLRQELSNPESKQNKARIQSLRSDLSGKQQQYEDVLTNLKLSSPEYASIVSVSPATLTDTQRLLDDRTTLLSYFVTADKTVAFVVTNRSLNMVELPVKEQDLESAINDFRGFATLDKAPPASLDKLYRWLVAPVKSYLNTPVVGVVPNGVLNYLPFAALYDAQSKQYLAAEYVLFSLPSASVLQYAKEKVAGGGAGASMLAMSEGQAPGLPVLAHADDEAKGVASLYGAQPLLGGDATVAAFQAKAGDSTLVHVVAHGLLNTASPLFSSLALAPQGSNNGAITVQDVYGLDLKKTDLVVLSACQTDLGAQSKGDDIVGLNRAFLYAGSPSTITSLWSVDDQATSLLMKSFYTHLKAGEGKAEALRSAQVEITTDYPNPYYWAGFVLTGNPGVTRSFQGGSLAATSGLGGLVVDAIAAGVVALLLAAGTGLFLRLRRR